MRALVAQQRDAIARADTKAIEAIRAQQIARVESVRALEAERRRTVRALAGTEDARVEHLAAAFEGAARDALLELSGVLRSSLAALRDEQAVVREAAEQMIGHMQGLMRQIHQRLSHSGTYGRGGRVDAGPSVVSGIDLTT